MIENVSPEEFLKIVDKTKRVHFEYRTINSMYEKEINLLIYGISNDSIIIKTLLKSKKYVLYDNIESEKYEEELKTFQEKLGVDITFGSYE